MPYKYLFVGVFLWFNFISANAQSVNINELMFGDRWNIDEALYLYELIEFGDTAISPEHIQAQLQFSRINGDTIGALKANIKKARMHYLMGDYGASYLLANKVLNNSKAIDPKVAFASKKLLRTIYFKRGEIAQASEINESIDWTSNGTNDWEYSASPYFTSLALILSANRAMGLSRIMQELKDQREKPKIYALYLYTIAHGYHLSEANDSAKVYYNRLQKFAAEHHHQLNLIESSLNQAIAGNIAEINVQNKEFLKIGPLIKSSDTSMIDVHSVLENQVRDLLVLLYSQVSLEQFDEAQRTVQQLEQLILKGVDPYYKILFQLNMYRLESTIGSDDSYAYLESAMNDLLENQDLIGNDKNDFSETISNLSELGTIESWKSQIDELKEQLQKENWSKKMLTIVLIVLSIVLAMSLQSLWKSSRRDRKLLSKNQRIREQSLQIQKTLEEKDLLLREVHHRVKNNLQIISSLFYLQSKKGNNPEASQIISEAQNRVQVMALIHQRLYQAEHLAKIDLHNYINDLGKQIIQSHQQKGIEVNLTINSGEAELPVDKALPMGMIVNELITNSIKHGFSDRKVGHIVVDFMVDKTLGRLVYSDDGIGITDVGSLQKGDSLGMKLIRLLTDQLNGVIEYHANKGFKMSLEFDV